MHFRKLPRRRFEYEVLEPRRFLSGSAAIKPAPIQVQYTRDQSLAVTFEQNFDDLNGGEPTKPDPNGSVFVAVSVGAANDALLQTGAPAEIDGQTTLAVNTIDIATAEDGFITDAAVSETQSFSLAPNLRSAQLTATFTGADLNELAFTAKLSLTFTSPQGPGVSTDAQVTGNGQSNTLAISRDLASSGSVTGTLTVNDAFYFPPSGYTFHLGTAIPATANGTPTLSEADSLTISSLPPSSTKALAAISTLQGQNNLCGLAGGIGSFQALLDQDALLSLPALAAFPADATQWLEAAVLDPASGVSGQVTQVRGFTQQSADATFDNGSTTQDINGQATITKQTTLLPAPKSTAATGDLAFSVQALAGGDATASGAADSGITLAGDASSASYSTTASLPATDANGNSLGNVKASAKLNWKEASGAVSFEYDVATQSSSTGGSVEFDDQITFPATVTGTLSSSLPGYVQPGLASGSLSQSGDLTIDTAVPVKSTVAANLFSAVSILLGLGTIDPAGAQILLSLIDLVDG